MKDVYETLLEFVDVLNELGLRYAVMGGLAVRAYSIPRPTWDVIATICRDSSRALRHAVTRFLKPTCEAGWIRCRYAAGQI